MYKIKNKKPRHFDYDLIVIGSGAGGGVTAHIAAARGKRVAIIENDAIGGECPNFGCVPTKSLIQAAETYHVAKEAAQFGIKTTGVALNYPAIKRWKDTAVHRTGVEDGRAAFTSDGITVLRGHAHFLDKWTISLRGRRYHAKHFLIATGTRNLVPPIPGLKESGYITYREAINFTSPPKSIFIIGGGAIGCEFAHIFNTFGAKVHIAEFAPKLLGREDDEVGALLADIFEKRGASVHLGAKVVGVKKQFGKKVVSYEKDGRTHSVAVEEVLLATGKAPNTDLGLDNAGVAYDRRGIRTNLHMQTSAPHIYAAGDVVGPYAFTHMASYQSRIAAHNMYSKKKVSANYNAVPRCIFVEPEIASVGASEQDLKDKKIKYQVGTAPISVVGRANTSNEFTGFVKILATKTGVILGASIVCPRAGEMIHELALAVHKGLKARDIVETIHAFPTWSEVIRVAANRINSR